jgi:hypothetical protein
MSSYVVWSIVIAVRIGNDSQTREVIAISEHRTRFHTISSVPNREAVSEEILSGSGYSELNLQLPVSSTDGLNRRKEPC